MAIKIKTTSKVSLKLTSRINLDCGHSPQVPPNSLRIETYGACYIGKSPIAENFSGLDFQWTGTFRDSSSQVLLRIANVLKKNFTANIVFEFYNFFRESIFTARKVINVCKMNWYIFWNFISLKIILCTCKPFKLK